MAGCEFTILTYNILHDIPEYRRLGERLQLIAAGIAAERPHLVALQEVARTPRFGHIGARITELVNQLCGAEFYRLHYEPADGAGEGEYAFDEGLALLSRLTREMEPPSALKYRTQVEISAELGGHHYRLPDDRIAVRVRCRLADAAGIDVYTTHLTDRPDRKDGTLIRPAQARELLEWIHSSGDAAQPVLVAGDLNDTPDSETLRCFTDAGFIDVYATAGFGNGYTNDRNDVDLESPGVSHNQRIDYLLLRPGHLRPARIVKAGLFLDQPLLRPDGGWLWPSDHIGVIATLLL